MDKALNARLAKIEARLGGVTPGPWEAFIEGSNHEDDSFIRTGGKNLYVTGGTKSDQEFIASARQDIPFLLEQLEDFVETDKPRIAKPQVQAAAPSSGGKGSFVAGLALGVVVTLLLCGGAYIALGHAPGRSAEPFSLNGTKAGPVTGPADGLSDFPLPPVSDQAAPNQTQRQ